MFEKYREWLKEKYSITLKLAQNSLLHTAIGHNLNILSYIIVPLPALMFELDVKVSHLVSRRDTNADKMKQCKAPESISVKAGVSCTKFVPKRMLFQPFLPKQLKFPYIVFKRLFKDVIEDYKQLETHLHSIAVSLYLLQIPCFYG